MHIRFDNGFGCEVFDPFDDETLIVNIQPLQASWLKRCTILVLMALLVLPLLLLYWSVTLQKLILYSECPLHKATHLFITGASSLYKQEIVSLRKAPFPPPQDTESSILVSTPYFDYRFVRYIYYESESIFKPLRFKCALDYRLVIERYGQGMASQQAIQQATFLYGECCARVPMKSSPVILIEEIMTPFFIFQIFSILLWFFDEYEIYAGAILFTTVVSLAISLIQTRSNLINLQKLSHYQCPIQVKRGQIRKISSLQLVPGDVIKVPESTVMPCDAVIISGGAVVNESMLTGESVPVVKSCIVPSDHDVYDPENDKNHTLFSGTEVIQTKNYGASGVFALVTKTGFLTAKGALVRSILFPKKSKFKFHADSAKFLMVLFAFAIGGIIISIPRNIAQGIDPTEIVLRSLDVFTITIPPALPAAMTVGTIFALARLKKANIFCISPNRVNVAGKVETFVFDKTGTLTEDGLKTKGFRLAAQFKGNVISEESRHLENTPRRVETHAFFTDFRSDVSEISSFNGAEKELKQFAGKWASPEARAVEGLASCHGLATLHGGKLVGDPLDIEMFQFTKWNLLENGEEDRAKKDRSIMSNSSVQSHRVQEEKKRQEPLLLQYDMSESEEDKGVVEEDSIVPIEVKPKGLPADHPYSLAILK